MPDIIKSSGEPIENLAGLSPKIREIHEIRGTEIYSHGFLETCNFQISPKIHETMIKLAPDISKNP